MNDNNQSFKIYFRCQPKIGKRHFLLTLNPSAAHGHQLSECDKLC